MYNAFILRDAVPSRCKRWKRKTASAASAASVKCFYALALIELQS